MTTYLNRIQLNTQSCYSQSLRKSSSYIAGFIYRYVLQGTVQSHNTHPRLNEADIAGVRAMLRDTTASHSVLRSPSVTPLVPSNTHHNQRHICHMQADDAHLGVPRCIDIQYIWHNLQKVSFGPYTRKLMVQLSLSTVVSKIL